MLKLGIYTHEQKKVHRSIIDNKSNKIDVTWYFLDNNSTYTVNKLKITFVNLNDKYVMPKSVSNDDVEKLVDLLGVFDGH